MSGKQLSPDGEGTGEVADAVWDETLSDHATAGSTGKALADVETDVTAILAAVSAEGIQLKFDFSKTGNVEEDQFSFFAIYLNDVVNGAIASANIDITSIAVDLSKSTGGAAFSNAGITQPTFTKANGIVSVNYRMLAAEWELGDSYKLTVSGIAVTIGSDTMGVPGNSWVASITEQVNVEGLITTIDTVVDGIATDVGDPSGHTLTSLTAKMGDMARSLDLLLGARWDSSGDLGTDIGNMWLKKLYASEVQATAVITGGSTDVSLPSVVVPNDADIGTIKRVRCFLKYRKIDNSNAGANAINGAADVQVKESVGGAYTDCIDITDNMMETDASAESGGDMVMGDIDVIGEVAAVNLTYDFQFDDIQADNNNLTLHDVQMFILIEYTV